MYITNLYYFLLAATSVAASPPLQKRAAQATPTLGITDCTYYVKALPSDTCAEIADTWGITTAQFLTYNPSVKSDCSGLVIGDTYCVEENNGLPPATSTPAPTSSSSSKSRSVVTTSSTSISTTSSVTTSSVPSGPSPTQTGIVAGCKSFYQTVSGDTCQKIVDKYGGAFSLSDFYTWNPAVGSDCSLLFLGYYYCVGLTATTPKPTTTTPIVTSSTTTVPNASHSPTQTGIVSTCTGFYQAVSGDTCQKIAGYYNTFTVAQFEAWNPAVQSDCSLLFIGYWYCISNGTPVTTTTKAATTTSTGPQPEQSGIVANCNKYYKVVSGDGCNVIETKNGVTDAQFRSWNTGIDAGCTNVFLGYYVCVGTS